MDVCLDLYLEERLQGRRAVHAFLVKGGDIPYLHPGHGFAMLYSTAACYVAPAKRSIFSRLGLCLFAQAWHRCLLPVLDALVLRVAG